MRKLTISVDWDGTCVVSDYPRIGVLRNGCRETLKKWRSEGHTIIINSCRAGQYEQDMRNFLFMNLIPFDYVNQNSEYLIAKYGTDTRKISADIYFDDKNAGGFKGWKWADNEVQKLSMMKPVIICIVGESGSGKTCVAEHIEREHGIKMIQSYTDRPRRSPTENGHTFVTDKEFDAFRKEDMIAFTQFGDYRYCCLKSDVQLFNTYVIDETGFIYLSDTFGDQYQLISLRLTCPLEERTNRASQERLDRDKGKFNLPLEFFDYIINTNCSVDETLSRVDSLLLNLL